MTIEHLKDGDVTHFSSEAMINLAEQMIVQLISESGPKRPGDLEDCLCGGQNLASWLSPLENWRNSPFYPALARLVDSDKVKYWIDNDGIVWYGLTEKPPYDQ